MVPAWSRLHIFGELSDQTTVIVLREINIMHAYIFNILPLLLQ